MTKKGGVPIFQTKIQFGSFHYDFITGEGILDRAEEWLGRVQADQYIVISDSGVPQSIVSQTVAVFETAGATHFLSFPQGEPNKNLLTVQELCRKALALGIDRRTAIVALGGGMTGNVAGMVAGLLFRGLPLIHIPTTLIAASDSVLSLKQGVNLGQGKNIVGFFYPPKMVCVELNFLQTLPAREIRSGLCELVKNLLTILPSQINVYEPLFKTSNQYGIDELQRFIEFCIEAKWTVMRDDPHERQHAVVLEYGHTIGHAVELLGNGTYTHGESVAFGMLCAARIARQMGLLSASEADMHYELLERIGVKVTPPAMWVHEIERYLLRDNKKGYRKQIPGKTGLVLLNGLGRIHREEESYITHVDNLLIREAILHHTKSRIQIPH